MTAESRRLVRNMYPDFDAPAVVAELRADIIPTVMRAYLRRDRAVLEQHFTDRLLQVYDAECKLIDTQGMRRDANILNIDMVSLTDVRTLEGDVPCLVVSWTQQQLNVAYDAKSGKIASGSDRDIRNFHYAWALIPDQQERMEGKLGWRVNEMVIQHVQQLVG